MTEPNVKDEDRERAAAFIKAAGPYTVDHIQEMLAVEFARLRERAERAEAALRFISSTADTLDPQEFINVAAEALGADRHQYPGSASPDKSIIELTRERDEQAARAETLRAALVACENYLADGDYGEEPDLRDVRDKALAALSATPAASLAALRLRDAERVRQSAIVIAHGACRTGEKCQDDGGCRHVPCITARMIVADLQRIDLSALLGIAPPAAQKEDDRG